MKSKKSSSTVFGPGDLAAVAITVLSIGTQGKGFQAAMDSSEKRARFVFQ